ncbi:MAG: hypothetical protein PHR35_12290, partial [Kiritimatiellae bacterium]|nr:hypothetical protein [Kiritimatiellia bacterium]
MSKSVKHHKAGRPRPGLGRGLGALIGAPEAETGATGAGTSDPAASSPAAPAAPAPSGGAVQPETPAASRVVRLPVADL